MSKGIIIGVMTVIAVSALIVGFGSADNRVATLDDARADAAAHGRRMLAECEKIYGKGNMAADCALAGLLRHANEYRSTTLDRIYRETK